MLVYWKQRYFWYTPAGWQNRWRDKDENLYWVRLNFQGDMEWNYLFIEKLNKTCVLVEGRVIVYY